MRSDLLQRRHRTDPHAGIVFGNRIEARYFAQVHQATRPQQVLLHQVEHIDAARLQDDAVRGRVGEHCVGDRRRGQRSRLRNRAR
jgi:hypothetical protein